MEILFFAVVAALVLGRLYQVLGQNRGAEPPPLPEAREQGHRRSGFPDGRRDEADAQDDMLDEEQPAPEPVEMTELGRGLNEIMKADRTFDPDAFVDGAKVAYEMIVTSFGSGDKETLLPLLSDEVYTAYVDAIDQRLAEDAAPIEIVRLSETSLVAAELSGMIARVDVKFSADLQDGGDGLRPTDEIWTFERNVKSSDPNWRLSAVEAV